MQTERVPLAATLVLTVAIVLSACADTSDVAADPAAASTAAGATPTAPATPTDPAAATADDEPTSDAGGDDPTAGTIEVSTLDGPGCPDDTVDADFPDVVGARFEPVADTAGEYRVAATLCSRYDTPERYADAWRVVTPGGDVLGTRELLHDHAGEQPFTRSLAGTVRIPAGVDVVVVEARDRANGWGGTTLEVRLDG